MSDDFVLDFDNLDAEADSADVSRILVVDDIADNRDILGRILERKGFQVLYATNGLEALDLTRAEQPNLILMDINMPGMDGFEACKKIKEDSELEPIPVIFISARDDAVDKLEAFSVGAVDYVTKPFEFREVVARVNTHLQLRQLQITVERSNALLKHSLQQLREVEAVRDQLVSMIVHDMRAPLSVASTSLLLAESGFKPETDSEVVEDIQSAQVAVSQTLDMAENMLLVRRLQAAEYPLSRGDHDVSALVGKVVEEMAVVAGAHEIEFKTEDKVRWSIDPDCLRRVLLNLIGNAFKAMPDAGKVTVEVKTDGSTCRVSVTDTGVGIPEESQHNIFDQFVSGKSEGYSHDRSAGLGLTMCKMGVEAHGGSIELTSQPGMGSTFTITLPAAT